MKGEGRLNSAVSDRGRVEVEGEFIGHLDGFRFAPDHSDSGHAARAVSAAARNALAPEIASRVSQLANDDDGQFDLDDEARLVWRGAPVARLLAGSLPLVPQIALLPSDWLDAGARRTVESRLACWLSCTLAHVFKPLLDDFGGDFSGPLRGLLFQLGEGLGSLPRRRVAAPLDNLTPEDRLVLARLGVRLGAESIFLPDLLKPKVQRLRAMLWCLHRGQTPIAPPPAGRVAVPATAPSALYEAVGFRCLGGTAVRLDMVERFAAELRRLARLGPVTPPPDWPSKLGVSAEILAGMIAALGYTPKQQGDLVTFRPPHRRSVARLSGGSADSPFAVLRASVPRKAP
jgi:ATP-dependent RNA helicase SUPV3L1/SUV3